MTLIIEIIGVIGISICFVGFIFQCLARKHINSDSPVKMEFMHSFKRAPLEEYSSKGKEYLAKSDNCAMIGVCMVLAYAVFAGFFE